MTGTYDVGSIVFDRQAPTSSLRVGDPITYAPPPRASPNRASQRRAEEMLIASELPLYLYEERTTVDAST
jgi:hypothetical protein